LGHFELAATKYSSPARAYHVIEQARGRSLADTLRGESESLAAGNETSLDAQREINRIQLALLHETNREARQSLLDELFRAEQFLAPGRNIALLNSASGRLKPIPLERLQESLGRNEMLLPHDLLAQHPSVGDVVRVMFQAPAIGYIDYRVTRIDDQGVHGVKVRNTVREIYPW
jgi:hypothetical protein